MAKAEEEYWRGQKRIHHEESEEDDVPVSHKRVSGETTRDNETDDNSINNLKPMETVGDRSSVSNQQRSKKVTLGPGLGAWGTMKFLLKIMWILCLIVPTSMTSTTVIPERYLSGYHLGGKRSEASLGSPMDPRCRRCMGDQLHPGVQESRVSLGNYHLGERGLGISLGSSRNPRCWRDTGYHLHPGRQRSRISL